MVPSVHYQPCRLAILTLYTIVVFDKTVFCVKPSGVYEISDDLGVGRRFDGIGAVSAGGATSKLLVNYPEPQRSQILDYLFKPYFGASLQILKVEIGGGDASVGSEASHMREEWDENYNRGYEWWIMKEAKKRNPNIKLYGLSWSWPGWLGADVRNPYKNLTNTVAYTIAWIKGAYEHHNLIIDFIGGYGWANLAGVKLGVIPGILDPGQIHTADSNVCQLDTIWNEQCCNPDYIIFLRKALNESNLSHVQIIGCDDWLGNFFPLMKNQTVAEATYAFGVHYPGTIIPQEALDSNLTIWSSEDYSTFNNDTGTGCWARILNRNYVVGYMTSTISWNLIASNYPGLPFEFEGLMTAVEPWSGHYEVKTPIWATAHTAQFTKIGYSYLLHKKGVGLLNFGGSYVSSTHDHSVCIRPPLPPYQVRKQKAIFKFGGTFVTLTELHLWRTVLNFENPEKSIIFRYEGKVKVVSHRLAMELDVDSIYTLTTSNYGNKGDYGKVPPSKPFPLPYYDNFEIYQLHEEPYLLSPQVGSFEITQDTDGNKFARQVVQSETVAWCMSQVTRNPVAIIGDNNWTDTNLTSQVRIPSINGTSQIFLAVRFSPGGCDTSMATGLFFWLSPISNGYAVTTDYTGIKLIDAGLTGGGGVLYDTWYTVSVAVQNHTFSAVINGNVVTTFKLDGPITSKTGWAALGTGSWGQADFDDLNIS